MPRPLIYLGLILLFGSANSHADASISPTLLAQPCMACHGTDGHSQGAIPPLNTLSSEYILQSLQLFKSGQRHATLMNRIAKGYSDEELQILADFFGTRP